MLATMFPAVDGIADGKLVPIVPTPPNPPARPGIWAVLELVGRETDMEAIAFGWPLVAADASEAFCVGAACTGDPMPGMLYTPSGSGLPPACALGTVIGTGAAAAVIA